MTPSKKQRNSKIETTPDLPGVILLFKQTLAIYKIGHKFFFGYTSWLLIPLAISVIAYSVLDNETFKTVDLIFGISLYSIISILVSAIIIKSTPFIFVKKPIPLKSIQTATLLAANFFITSLLLNLATYLGLILLIVPGIIIATWFAFAPFIVILEEEKISEAFKTSKILVKNRFLAVAWRYFGGQLIIIGLQASALGIILLISMTITGNNPLILLETPIGFYEDFLFRATNILFLPLNPIYGTLLYISLKNR